jgi:hypothetical protein
VLAFGVRLAWVLAVPTVPVSDFAMYRESANYLSEFGHLDPGFIYMPGLRRAARVGQGRGRRAAGAEAAGRRRSGRWAPGDVRVAYKLSTMPMRDAAREPATRAWRVSARVRTRPRRRCCSRCGPPGVAMSSVVGTDMPAAALLALALALLVTLGRAGRWSPRWRSARRWACAPGCGRWRCRCRRWRSATGWRAGRSSLARRC